MFGPGVQYHTHCCPPWWQGGCWCPPCSSGVQGGDYALVIGGWKATSGLERRYSERCVPVLPVLDNKMTLISHDINSAHLCWMVSQQCCSKGSEPLARPNPHTVLLTAHSSTWRSILTSSFVGCHGTSLSTGRTPSFPQLLADKTMHEGSTWLLLSPSTSTIIVSAFQQELIPKHEISDLKHIITQRYTVVSDRSC